MRLVEGELVAPRFQALSRERQQEFVGAIQQAIGGLEIIRADEAAPGVPIPWTLGDKLSNFGRDARALDRLIARIDETMIEMVDRYRQYLKPPDALPPDL